MRVPGRRADLPRRPRARRGPGPASRPEESDPAVSTSRRNNAALAGRSRGSFASPRITSSRATSGPPRLAEPLGVLHAQPAEVGAEVGGRPVRVPPGHPPRRRHPSRRCAAGPPRVPGPCTAECRIASRASAAAQARPRPEDAVPPVSSSSVPGSRRDDDPCPVECLERGQGVVEDDQRGGRRERTGDIDQMVDRDPIPTELVDDRRVPVIEGDDRKRCWWRRCAEDSPCRGGLAPIAASEDSAGLSKPYDHTRSRGVVMRVDERAGAVDAHPPIECVAGERDTRDPPVSGPPAWSIHLQYAVAKGPIQFGSGAPEAHRRAGTRMAGQWSTVESILDLVGNTPLVRLSKVTEGLRPLVLAKLEQLHPGWSVKDRIGLSMLEDAEGRGLLQARRHDRRADVGQHRPRARHGRADQGATTCRRSCTRSAEHPQRRGAVLHLVRCAAVRLRAPPDPVLCRP